MTQSRLNSATTPSSSRIYGFLFSIFSVLLMLIPAIGQTVPSFPGAEGYGGFALGGRGDGTATPSVYIVTNTDDYDQSAGDPVIQNSLRWALSQTGPRFVVFETGGTIYLKKNLIITQPYVTIAGQTAPGDGICFRDNGIVIRTHDVIVRGMRGRVGNENFNNLTELSEREAFKVGDDAYNVIFDHCSASWGVDGNIEIYGENISDVTVQYSIISECLRKPHANLDEHSFAMLISNTDLVDSPTNISIHHNLFMHQQGRQPRLAKNADAEIINNIVFNWQDHATVIHGTTTNLVGNEYVTGPDWANGQPEGISVQTMNFQGTVVPANAYLDDNRGPTTCTQNCQQIDFVDTNDPAQVSSTPVLPLAHNVTVDARSALKTILTATNGVGAVHPARDAVDSRLITELSQWPNVAPQWGIIDSQDEVGGWPAYPAGTPPTDDDDDGMADSWEAQKGVSDPFAFDISPHYMNLEVYLNQFYQNILPKVGETTDVELPGGFALNQNYPNPFNPSTVISYQLPADATVSLKIYDVSGQVVRDLANELAEAGEHNIVWDSTNDAGERVVSGMYLYRLEATTQSGEQFQQIRKLVLLK